MQADIAGARAQADALRNAALEAAALNPGSALAQGDEEAQPFGWLVDGDSRLGPVCELLVNGHYFGCRSALSPRCASGADERDRPVWRHTLVQLVDGAEQVCQVPVRYPFDADAQDRLRLASLTEWRPLDEAQQHYVGQGQKVWLNDEAEFPLLSTETLTFVASDVADA